MLLLSNFDTQIIQPGQSVIFNETLLNTNGCCCNRHTRNSAKLCSRGAYEVSFTGNVSGDAGTQANLAIALGGEIRPETTMTATITAAGDVFNVSATTLVNKCCCDFDRITVVNTGTTPVTLAANPSLAIHKVGN